MITLKNISLNRGAKVLLNNANVLIHKSQKVGLIGKNGCGKSSLFAALKDPDLFSSGECEIIKNSSTAFIDQDMPEISISALEYASRGHQKYSELMDRLSIAESEENNNELVTIHNAFSENNLYSIPAQTAKILIGLGFTQENINHPVNQFSGGWRMRLNLARVLLSDADLLLLDEPTNHLDLEAIVWLENWLQKSQSTVIIISHDRLFLDNTVKFICHIEHQRLFNYTGNYSEFEKIRAEKLALESAQYEKQQKQRAHLQSFVDRFRYKASKAKQAQSRLKMLEKLDDLVLLKDEAVVDFKFLPAEHPGSPMISVRDLNLGYSENQAILKHLNLSLMDQDRIGLIGPNGAGKSTLIKFLAGKLKPLKGDFEHNPKIKVGYFAQHLLDQLDLNSTPLEIFLSENKDLSDAQARKILGRYQFGQDDISRSISSLSGGERARLVLGLIIYQKPNLLLLDEPTNHLDLHIRDSLNRALQNFTGATVIVSHDRFFLSSVSDQFWLVYNGKCEKFNGDLDYYQKWYSEEKILNTQKDLVSEQAKSKKSNIKSNIKKSPSKIKFLEKELKKAESELEIKILNLDKIDQQMSEYSLDLDKLNELSKEREIIQKNINNLEEKILELMEGVG